MLVLFFFDDSCCFLAVVFLVALLCDLKHCWLQEQEAGKCAKWDGLTKQDELIQGEFKYWPSISTHSTEGFIF